MDIIEPTTPFATALEDSLRWKLVNLRPDDIVISTPPKCGTTWMQGIVSSLLWPEGDAPGRLGARSPWPDVRFGPADAMAEQVEAITHRRFLKSHSPATALPFADEVRYIVVYRNAHDALASWGNHRESMLPEIMRMANNFAAADGIDPMVEVWAGDDWQLLFDEWTLLSNPIMHLASWWPLRQRENVLMVHYADLYADLEAGMRQIAGFLDIDFAEQLWPDVVDRCTLSAMREEARTAPPGSRVGFRDGVDSFYFKGGVGRGAEVLPAEIVDQVNKLDRSLLPPEASEWLSSGAVAGL